MRKPLGISLGLFATATLLFGQSAELNGLVKDPSGASIAQARLEVRNQDNGSRYQSVTNRDGLYRFPVLRPGIYDATVQANGFRTLTRSAIGLNVGDVAVLDFTLPLGQVSDSITVTSDADTEAGSAAASGAISTVVDQQFVGNLPLNGRSFQSLIHLTPGVTPMRSYQDAPGQFSVNGQRTNANYFTIDGVSANFAATASFILGETISGATPGLNILGGTNGLLTVDAMQEFRVQTSAYAPEYGRTPGAQVSIVTKSGSNQAHGTAFDYLRNDILDARNWFNTVPQPKPPLRQNDFGGMLSGPVRKNQSFFLVSYEGLRLRQPGTAKGDFLTAAARARVPAVYQPMVSAFPLPSGSVNADGITAPLTVSYSDPSWFDATSFRGDQIWRKVMLFGRYNHSPSEQGARSFSSLEKDIASIDTATFGAIFILSPSQVNDLRANWSYWRGTARITMDNVAGAVSPPRETLFPSFADPDSSAVNFSIGFTSGGISWGTRADNIQRQLNLVDQFSATAGLHQLKFGTDIRRMQATNSPANFLYGARVNDYDTLLSGSVNVLLRLATEPITARLYNYSLFAQDAWKISDHLTITYGLRWDINTPPSSTRKGKPMYALSGIFDSGSVGLSNRPLWSTRFGSVAPRFGAAWRVRPRTVIRGGFGLFYDLGYAANTPLAVFPYQRTAATTYSPAIPFDPNSAPFGQLPFSATITPGVSVPAIDPQLRSPSTWQWNLAWEHQFGPRQSLSGAYVGASGRDLLRQDLLIPAGSIFATSGGSVRVTRNGDHSRYHALQLEFIRRMSRGVQMLVTYRLAESKDTGSSDVGLGSSASYAVDLAGSVKELVVPPEAPSDFDSRHTFSAAISWEPKPAWKWLRGWALDSLVRSYSALPVNVLYQRLFPAGYYDVQPDVVPGLPLWIANANEPQGRVINPAAFRVPAGKSGNFPRNSLRGFPFNQADVALRRRFSISDRLKLDARVEYFNVLNHPMFGSPVSLWAAGNSEPLPSFGKVIPGNTLNVGLGGGGLSGGQAAIYAPGGPRSAQLTLKLTF